MPVVTAGAFTSVVNISSSMAQMSPFQQTKCTDLFTILDSNSVPLVSSKLAIGSATGEVKVDTNQIVSETIIIRIERTGGLQASTTQFIVGVDCPTFTTQTFNFTAGYQKASNLMTISRETFLTE